jgi:DNA-binding CsgD family transcriptional regulator
MTQMTVVQLAGDAVLSAAQPRRVSRKATGKSGLEPDVVDTVTIAFDARSPVEVSLTIAASGATGTTRVRVQVQGPLAPGRTPHWSLQVSVINPEPASSADWAAETVEANRSSIPALASLLSLPARLERGDDYPVCAREWNQVTARPAALSELGDNPRLPAAGRGGRGARTAGGLTGRELEIMLLVARGNTSRQIGQALFISPRTVEMHVQGSLLKLGCRTRADAVRRLAELGTLSPDDAMPVRG